ncbi:LysR family transcriptional regulator [Brevibacterium sp. UCMA 11752]|uniref:LysR family transcriptional regulator n=1 Tax=Brevibacterium sp. UCMA 11752 TaxID=2745946 RepID=UPI001F359B6B|nr:LysR family transcriptional regulator [Brevibacterium sp. UCMA 11752]MCF2585803.1 LysR family transcriptional regulator [Brevibacterium sp. UCMA 11752]
MDLNLLRIFIAVYETRSLTEAANRLFITQPAVSQALGRLRRSLDDSLFERSGRGMAPTPLAHSIYPDFHGSLLAIDRTLDTVHGFDPASSDHHFRIAMSELGEVGYFPALYSAVSDAAPKVTVEVVPIDVSQLSAWLSRGTIDLAISPMLPNGSLDQRLLKIEDYVALLNQNNELATGELTVQQLLDSERAVVTGDSGSLNLQTGLNRMGSGSGKVVTVHRFSSIPPLLSACEKVLAIVPESIAEGWAATWPLTWRPLPFDLPPTEISLLRRMTLQHTSALDWLHQKVLRTLSGKQGEFSSIGASPPPKT